uniref:Uncharacterized protein n=1 Tax=Bradyrhizobium japonicum TaxID=375 RepID=Q9RHC4_BRAJP|nr:unknown [Bradyrhizobium japonicum]
MFALAAAGLHFLARFQCVEQTEPRADSLSQPERRKWHPLNDMRRRHLWTAAKHNLSGNIQSLYDPRMAFLSVEQPDDRVSSTSGIAVDFVRDWRQAALRLNGGHRTAFQHGYWLGAHADAALLARVQPSCRRAVRDRHGCRARA